MKRYWIIAMAGLLAWSCEEDDGPVVHPDLGYAYFPLEIGAFVEYSADSIYHDQPSPDIPGIHDTTRYFIREVCDTIFIDAEGDEAMRIERFKRDDENEIWQIVDVWSAKLTAMNAQRVEENRRYIKLGFPVSPDTEWNGNALNILDERTYEYDSIGVARTYGELEFEETIRVSQRDFKNLVDDEYAYEIYARNAGLVYKYHRDLVTQINYVNNPVASNIRLGIEYRWEIVDYGME